MLSDSKPQSIEEYIMKDEKIRISKEIIGLLCNLRNAEIFAIDKGDSDVKYFFHTGRASLITDIINEIEPLIKK